MSNKMSVELLALCDHIKGVYPRGVGPSLVERVPGYVETRRLAESGALDALLEALQAAFEVAFTGPSTPKGSNCDESAHEWKMRVRRECEAAIRAFEPGWKP